jgi:hypothetical protein
MAQTFARVAARPGLRCWAWWIRWLHGYATDLPPLQVELVTMTGNEAECPCKPSGAWMD